MEGVVRFGEVESEPGSDPEPEVKKRNNELPRMTRGKDLNTDPFYWFRRGATREESEDWALYDKRVLHTMDKLAHTQAKGGKRACC